MPAAVTVSNGSEDCCGRRFQISYQNVDLQGNKIQHDD